MLLPSPNGMVSISAISPPLTLLAVISACAAPPPEAHDLGVLVMAHGGTPEWNRGVLDALQPAGGQLPLEVAFGMADAATIQDGVSRLEAKGVRRIAVVRLFASGESWLERTEQILGLRDGAPPRPANHAPGALDAAAAADAHAGHHSGHSMELWRIATKASFALSKPGLLEAPEMGRVLADRARALSSEPEREDVLVLAHGPADDTENERWLARMEQRAGALRDALPFRRVSVKTLREDWPEKRAAAERDIRAFVSRARDEGGRALVIPFRVHGFGPYAEVLRGLDYAADGQGLIPHAEVTRWVGERIGELRAGPFRAPVTGGTTGAR